MSAVAVLVVEAVALGLAYRDTFPLLPVAVWVALLLAIAPLRVFRGALSAATLLLVVVLAQVPVLSIPDSLPLLQVGPASGPLLEAIGLLAAFDLGVWTGSSLTSGRRRLALSLAFLFGVYIFVGDGLGDPGSITGLGLEPSWLLRVAAFVWSFTLTWGPAAFRLAWKRSAWASRRAAAADARQTLLASRAARWDGQLLPRVVEAVETIRTTHERLMGRTAEVGPSQVPALLFVAWVLPFVMWPSIQLVPTPGLSGSGGATALGLLLWAVMLVVMLASLSSWTWRDATWVLVLLNAGIVLGPDVHLGLVVAVVYLVFARGILRGWMAGAAAALILVGGVVAPPVSALIVFDLRFALVFFAAFTVGVHVGRRELVRQWWPVVVVPLGIAAAWVVGTTHLNGPTLLEDFEVTGRLLPFVTSQSFRAPFLPLIAYVVGVAFGWGVTRQVRGLAQGGAEAHDHEVAAMEWELRALRDALRNNDVGGANRSVERMLQTLDGVFVGDYQHVNDERSLAGCIEAVMRHLHAVRMSYAEVSVVCTSPYRPLRVDDKVVAAVVEGIAAVVNNAIVACGASRAIIRIVIGATSSGIVVDVTDNGPGWAGPTGHETEGSYSWLPALLAHVGGSVEVSSPGAGTRVTFTVDGAAAAI